MPKAPTAQQTLDAVAPVQDCARWNRFHHHRRSLPHCFLSDYNMGNGECWYNDLHHIPTMLAYLPSALYTKCTHMSSVGWPGRKMVLFIAPGKEYVAAAKVKARPVPAKGRPSHSACIHANTCRFPLVVPPGLCRVSR